MARDRKPAFFTPSNGPSPSPKPMPSRPILEPKPIMFRPASFTFKFNDAPAQETSANQAAAPAPAPAPAPKAKALAHGVAFGTPDNAVSDRLTKKLKGPSPGLQTSLFAAPTQIIPFGATGVPTATSFSTPPSIPAAGSFNSPVPALCVPAALPTPASSIPNSPLTQAQVDAHKLLLSSGNDSSSNSVADEVAGAPIFVEPVRTYAESLPKPIGPGVFSQYGLLGGDLRGVSLPDYAGWTSQSDPRIFYNIATPSSVFICGSQGSGKSHTLGCLLENCLVPSEANTLPRPLTGLVFHYDSFISDSAGSPCEAAYLSSRAGVHVRVLCSPTNTGQIKRIYSKLPNVVVEELRINESDLNTQRMLDLMAVRSSAGHGLSLYLSVINRILRELRIEQQANNVTFSYGRFKHCIDDAALTDAQLAPLQQRLETLESFMVQKEALAYDLFKTGAAVRKTSATEGNDWSAKSGRLTIVDLSCPCITAEMACSLFGICLSLFLEQTTQIGRIVALDEAHKFMTNTAECASLTESLLSTIRLQRHLGARVIISTQEPTISPRLLDLCSVTIVHRFTSPDWLATLKQHLAGASVCMDAIDETEKSKSIIKSDEDDMVQPRYAGIRPLSIKTANVASGLFQEIVSLNTGEALMFAPNAVIGLAEQTAATVNGQLKVTPERLGSGVLKVRIRKRVTQDGGRSIMAV